MGTILESRVQPSHPDFYKRVKMAHAEMPATPLDLRALCDGIDGLDVTFADDLGEDVSGCIIKRGERCKILINNNEPAARKRFTLAHELAHFLLHKDDLGDKFPENILLRGGLSNRKEVEANRLASEILMPFDAIDKATEERIIKQGGFTISDMAQLFQVSNAAMAIRLGIPLDF